LCSAAFLGEAAALLAFAALTTSWLRNRAPVMASLCSCSTSWLDVRRVTIVRSDPDVIDDDALLMHWTHTPR